MNPKELIAILEGLPSDVQCQPIKLLIAGGVSDMEIKLVEVDRDDGEVYLEIDD